MTTQRRHSHNVRGSKDGIAVHKNFHFNGLAAKETEGDLVQTRATVAQGLHKSRHDGLTTRSTHLV